MGGMTDSRAVQELKRRLANKGYRLTQPRELVFKLLRAKPYHADANWIYDHVRQELPHISLGTIYRTLSVLVEAGLVRELHCGNGHARYDADVQPHYHAICRRCGALADVSLPRRQDLDQAAAEATGFAIDGHHLDFYGLCPACQVEREVSPEAERS